MKKKLVKILLVITFGVICSILASYYTAYYMNNAHMISTANSNLYNLSYIVDALDEFKESKPKNQLILNKLETILVLSLITLRAINPDMSELQGTPKNTLCRIIKYNREVGIAKNGIGEHQEKELPKVAIAYLGQIEPELRKLSEGSIIPFFECNKLFDIQKKYKILKKHAF